MEANEEFDKMVQSENDLYLLMFNKNTIEEKGELISSLKYLNFEMFSDKEFVTGKLFDYNNLDEDMSPKIITEENSVVVFDNVLYNSTYLIDIVNNAVNRIDEFCRSLQEGDMMLKIFDNIKNHTKYYYCNNPFTRSIIFNGKKHDSELIRKDFFNYERTNLKPCIMSLNKQRTDNQIIVMEENMLSTLKVEDVMKFLTNYVG